MVGAIAIGAGSNAATESDSRMRFELTRVPVTVSGYDFQNNHLVFKGTLDESVSGVIYEVGLWTDDINILAGSQESEILTTFETDIEEWDFGASSTSFTRVGESSLRLNPGTGATVSSMLSGLQIGFEDYTSLDVFTLAYHVVNGFTSNIKLRLRTDASNYYEWTISSPSSGYKLSTLQKGNATIVGAPEWEDINDVVVSVTSTGGGSADVHFDGLRIDDIDTIAPEYGLVARTVLGAPVVKSAGRIRDIEYVLEVDI